MQQYCLGFIFLEDKSSVVLIKKSRPAWQKGKLNGIGGHVESGEDPRSAMIRECYEETGVYTGSLHKNGWKSFADMGNITMWRCHCYACFNDEYFWSAKTTTDETIIKLNIPDELYIQKDQMIENILTLINAALIHETYRYMDITYK
jgi:8-oxo-dGTP diphosphatase